MMSIPVDDWSLHGYQSGIPWAFIREFANSATQSQAACKVYSRNLGGGTFAINRTIIGVDLTPFATVVQANVIVTDKAGGLAPTDIHISDVTPQTVVAADAAANFGKMYAAYVADPIGAMTQRAGLVYERDVTAWWNANVGGWAWLGLVERVYDFGAVEPAEALFVCEVEKPGDTGYPFLEYSSGPGIIGDGIMP